MYEDSQNINNVMIGDKDVHFLTGGDFQIGNRMYTRTLGNNTFQGSCSVHGGGFD